MDQENSFNPQDVVLLNTQTDQQMPDELFGTHHLHILCRGGKADFLMNGKAYTIEKGDFVIWQIGSDISNCQYSADFDADFLAVSSSFLIANNPEQIWATKAFVFLKNNPVFHLDENGIALIDEDFRQFRIRLSQRQHIFQEEQVGSILNMLLFDMWQIYSEALRQSQASSNSAAEIFQHFIQMVSDNAVRERKISFYSDRLFVSSKYLSEVSRSYSSKPASEWITGYATQALVSMLKDQSLTLTQISDRMNFPNYPNFTKYVKANIGMSPTEYRQRMLK